LHALARKFPDAVGDTVVGEVGQVAAEGVRLHGVRTGREVRPVDPAQYVGPGVVEDLVAAFETEEVRVDVEVCGLQHGAHRTVGDEDTGAQCGEQGRSRVVGHALIVMAGVNTFSS